MFIKLYNMENVVFNRVSLVLHVNYFTKLELTDCPITRLG